MSDLFLVDAKNLLWRMASGVGKDADPRDLKGAVLDAFLRALVREHRTLAGGLVIVVWEGEKNWRKALFPAYKAHREEKSTMPAWIAEAQAETRRMLTEGIEDLRGVLRALGVRQARPVDGEADDALAAIAHRACERGHTSTIFTGDNDLLQAVRPGVRVSKPGRNGFPGVTYATDETVEEKLGVPPQLVADMKGIAGDASDNIPGVPGLGEVKASRIVKEHGGLEGAITAAAGTAWRGTERERKLIQDHALDARLFARLARLDLDVVVEHDRPARDRVAALSAMHRLGLVRSSRQGTFFEIGRDLAAPSVSP